MIVLSFGGKNLMNLSDFLDLWSLAATSKDQIIVASHESLWNCNVKIKIGSIRRQTARDVIFLALVRVYSLFDAT